MTTAEADPPRRYRLVVAATHPIQYQVPWFQALSAHPELDVLVLFGVLPDSRAQGKGFGIAFQWDIPLLEGYAWRQLDAVTDPNPLGSFRGIRLREPLATLRRLRPDVLLLTGWQSLSLLQLLAAARWLGIPSCVRGDSNGFKLRGGHLRLLHRLLLAQYRAFLVVGQANERFYRRNGVKSRRLFQCPHFVDNERLAKQTQETAGQRVAIRADWEIPEDRVCFCFAGKLEAKKRPLDLLEALRRVVAGPDHAPIHLLMVGTGELLDQCREFAERHRLPVSFAGFLNQTEIARAYLACDCLVLPSDYGETWGLVVNEAMACGRPAIVSDRVGCGPDLVEDGITGWRFPFGNIEALAGRLRDAAADPANLRRLGGTARDRVLAHYNVAQAVAGTVAATRYLLGNRG